MSKEINGTSVYRAVKERFGLLLSYLGGLFLYFSTDFSEASAMLHPKSGKMIHPVGVTNEKLLILGIFLIAIGFIIDFSKDLKPEWKIVIAGIALFPLWGLLGQFIN